MNDLTGNPAIDMAQPSANATDAVPALQLTQVSKIYRTGKRADQVLDRIGFSAAPGEFISLIGPSGCGKSTILRLIAGLDPDYGGDIHVNGERVRGPGVSRGMLFQEHRLFPWLTVRQNVALGAYHARRDTAALQQRIDTELSRVGLLDYGLAYPQQLSGGMAQRVAIARTLMSSPDVLLLDEPFSALDAFTRLRLQAELEGIWAGTKMTMVLVTHDIEEAAYLSDRILVMSAHPGRIRAVIDNDCPRPRDRVSTAFNRVKDSLFRALDVAPAAPASRRDPEPLLRRAI